MTRRISSIMILSLLLFAFMATAAFAAKTAKEAQRRKINPLINKLVHYSFPDENFKAMSAPGKTIAKTALGGATPSQSPGRTIGGTWYDYQRNGSMRRMIEWGTHGTPDTLVVHFSWMYLPSELAFGVTRSYQYDSWNAAAGGFGTEVSVNNPPDDYGGYVGVAVTGDDRAIMGGHNNPNNTSVYGCQFYWDFGPQFSFFNFNSRVPDSVGTWEGDQSHILEDHGIWPAFAYVEGPGANDTVLHVIANKTGGEALFYFRRVGSDTDPTAAWDYPPYVIDSVYVLAHDLDATNDGKVGLAWHANLPCPGDPPTWSGYGCAQFAQWDNDLYYQLSIDYGASFLPRVNVTKNVDGQEGYRPYSDLSCLFDANGDFHIVYGTMYWPADANQGGDAGLLRGRLFHVSSADPTKITTVHNYEWDQTTCNGGAWNLNASKMSISQCNGKLYTLFVQFNDPDITMTDCADAGNPGFPRGAANGDLYITISDDGGTTWDKARDLTNSRTPGCDSTGGVGGPCDNDHWPSMTRFGTNYAGTFPPDVVVVPTGSTDPLTYYLDVQYVNDHSAGGIVQSEGTWQNAEIKWIRVPCVDPIRAAQIYLTPPSIDYPSWSKHGVPYDTTVKVEAGGNDSLFYTISKNEIIGPIGWLAFTPTSGSSAAGEKDPITVTINPGGTIINNPGTIEYLSGNLVFHWWGATAPVNPPGEYDTVQIEHVITDTLYPPIFDTISTACTKLAVSNRGDFGQQGIGRVNMDYAATGDCDTTNTVYLYDGSVVIGYVKGGNDTLVNFSIFNTNYIDTSGFIPLGDHTPTTDMGEYEVFESGKFVTHDSLIAIEKIWYAPKAGVDSCSFVIECIKVYLNDTLATPPTGVYIGEAIDWDIPADTGSRNGSSFNSDLNLIYQWGCEEDTGSCQLNDRRFGGMDFLDAYKNGVRYTTLKQHGAYTWDNPTYVYPAGGFVQDSLYKYMANSGYAISDSTCTDLNMVMTFDTLGSLTKADTFVFYIELVSHLNGDTNSFFDEVRASQKWYCDHLSPEPCGCCQNRGNVDHIVGIGGPIDVSDLTYLVQYLFTGGSAPPCLDEGNVDGIVGIGGPIDVSDLTYLVQYLFTGGTAPPGC